MDSLFKILVAHLMLLSWHPLMAAGPVVLSENSLTTMAQNSSNPRLQSINAQSESAQANNYQVGDRFNPKLSAAYNYASSNEDAIIQFLPVFHPQRNFQVGLEQNLPIGMKAKLGVFGQQISTADGFVNNATQVGSQLGLEIDIWKNFFGSLDRADLRAKRISSDVAQLQAQTDTHAFVLDVRKIYWVLVSNQISLDLSKQLVNTAQKQLADSIKRAREGAADRGDVARNRALLQSRESAVMGFTYLREVYLAQLKSMLPELKDREVIIDTSPRSNAEAKARYCIAQISRQTTIDKNHSQYPTIIDLLKEQRDYELKLANATDSMDLKIMGQYQASGVDGNHADAFNRYRDDFKNGYQVGINLNIPLGSDLRKARESRVAVVSNQFTAKIQQLDLQLTSEHEKVRKALLHLNKALEAQSGIVKNLEISLKQTQKKYSQARVPLNTLILEQDNAFNARLQEIDTKRQIIHLLLDYFKIFNRYPCSTNILAGGPS